MRRASSAAAFSVLVTALAACGGGSSNSSSSSSSSAASGSSSSASGAGTVQGGALAGLTGKEIATKALSQMQQATSVHVTGKVQSEGSTIELDMSEARGKGCAGTFKMVGKGSFRLTLIGRNSWLSADRKFWQSFGTNNSTVLDLLAGKWIKLSQQSAMTGLTDLCSLTTTLPKEAGAEGVGDLELGAVGTVSGQQAQELLASDQSRLFVSISATPQLLRIVTTGTDAGQVDFGQYNAPVKLTPPPAAKVLDGSRYGI